MRESNKHIKVIYHLLLLFFILGSLILEIYIIPTYLREYARMASLLIWVGLFASATQIPGDDRIFKGRKEKIKTTIIIVTLYYALYFLIGLIVGYEANPFSRISLRMLENIVFMLGFTLAQEYVRSKLINNQRNIHIYVMITIMFLLINMDITTFMNTLQNKNLLYEYACGTVLPNFAISALCTYLAASGGFKLVYAYIVPVKLIEILSPVFPNLDWSLVTVLKLILVMTIVFYNSYEHVVKTERLTRRELKKESPLKMLPFMIVLIIVVGFIAGLLPFKPVAIMSNSMVPRFSRGSIVITEKVGRKYEKVEKGDIIEFKTERGNMIHRVVEIEKTSDGQYLYVTKGDANFSNDPEKVEQRNIVAVAKYTIPYAGYPYVWFYELITGSKVLFQL